MVKEEIFDKIETIILEIEEIAKISPQIKNELESAIEKLEIAKLCLNDPNCPKEGGLKHRKMVRALHEFLKHKYGFKKTNPKKSGKYIYKNGIKVSHVGKTPDLFGKASDGSILVGEAEVKSGNSDSAINKWTYGKAFEKLRELFDVYNWDTGKAKVFIATNVHTISHFKDTILPMLRKRADEYGFHNVHLLEYDESSESVKEIT